MTKRLEEFREWREKMNARILEAENLEVRRFFALDSRVYEDGRLDTRTKELLGLVSSLVLRCDDCIAYHMIRCRQVGWEPDELMEALSVGLVVGGSIVIPHMRRAVELMDELDDPGAEASDPPDGGP
ncbi:MAG: carboxymuconolactone decarboxylase family protein [Gemmatimonadales bacterium]|nr:MAG: carboxymuconolactone decarboxylase family protein [Gemmatimonadales bacterium]